MNIKHSCSNGVGRRRFTDDGPVRGGRGSAGVQQAGAPATSHVDEHTIMVGIERANA